MTRQAGEKQAQFLDLLTAATLCHAAVMFLIVAVAAALLYPLIAMPIWYASCAFLPWAFGV
jgi:hypothetical protein